MEAPANPIKHYPTFGQSLLLLLSMLLFALPAAMFFMVFHYGTEAWSLTIIYTSSMVGSIGLGLYLRKSWAIPLKFDLQLFLITLIGFILMMAVDVVLELPLSYLPVSDMLLKVFTGAQQDPVLYFIMVVISAPILEELLVRGIILDGFLKNYKPLYAILLSAFLFGLIHGNLPQGLSAFFSALILGWIYWKTQSLIPCMLLHFLNNLTGFVSIINTPAEDFDQTLLESIGHAGYYWTLYVVSIFIAIVLVWELKKRL